MEQHVRDDLSAYLDGELAPAERALVQGHLDGCAACRAAAAEIAVTVRVIAALPPPAPPRRLVPSLTPRFAWFRPVRSLSAVLSGVFILVFMASATLDTGWRMGGGKAGGAATTAAQPARQLGAPAAQEAVRSPAIAAPAASATAAARVEAAPAVDTGGRTLEPLRIGPTPWLWLGLALLSGMLALVAHRRLRAT